VSDGSSSLYAVKSVHDYSYFYGEDGEWRDWFLVEWEGVDSLGRPWPLDWVSYCQMECDESVGKFFRANRGKVPKKFRHLL